MTDTLETSERQLATIRTVDRIDPIPDADRIEVAVVDGWQVIVKKGEYKPGDLAVYFEVDSLLPVDNPHFAFLAGKAKDGKYRLRTMRMRGVISQGLLVPYSCDEVDGWYAGNVETLAEAFGVTKYEPPVHEGRWGFKQGNVGGPFPQHLAWKTDSERAQNLAKRWDDLLGFEWYATEKIDGTSLTVARDGDGELVVASRNLARHDDGNVYWDSMRQFKLDRIANGEAVQGEIVGPGIQGNPLGLQELRVYVFKYWRNCKPVPRIGWPEWALELSVPIFGFKIPANAEDAIALADGLKSKVNPDKLAEGIVWHTSQEDQVRALDYRTNFKVINNTWLLKVES